VSISEGSSEYLPCSLWSPPLNLYRAHWSTS